MIVGLFTLLFLSNIVLGQKSNSVQFFGSPFIQKIGNLNNQYTEVSSDYIEVDYLKIPSKEFGIEFHHNCQSKWGYSLGFSWSNSEINAFTTLRHPQYTNNVLMNNYNTLQYSSVGIRLGCSYRFKERIILHSYLSFYLPYDEKRNTNWQTDYSTGSQNFYNYNTRIVVPGAFPNIIPDFRADFEIYQNLYFFIGMRLKFWDLLDLYRMKVEVTGYVGQENSGTNEVLHLSKVNGTDISYYFGLMYNLPILKRKNKVE